MRNEYVSLFQLEAIQKERQYDELCAATKEWCVFFLLFSYLRKREKLFSKYFPSANERNVDSERASTLLNALMAW